MSSWIHIEPKALPLAIEEYKKLTLEGARLKFGFHAANKVHMYYGETGPFEARVLVAVAYSIQFPNRSWLTPKSFDGNEANKYLESAGFKARPIVRGAKSSQVSYLRAA